MKHYFIYRAEAEIISKAQREGASVYFVSKNDEYNDKFFSLEKKHVTSLYRYFDEAEEGEKHVIIVFEKYLKNSVDRICTLIRSYGSFKYAVDPSRQDYEYIQDLVDNLNIDILYKLELKGYLRMEKWIY